MPFNFYPMSKTLQWRDGARDDSSSASLFASYPHDDAECPLVMEMPHKILSIGEVYRKWFKPDAEGIYPEEKEDDALHIVSLFMDPEPLQDTTFLTFDLETDAAAMDCTIPLFLELPW